MMLTLISSVLLTTVEPIVHATPLSAPETKEALRQENALCQAEFSRLDAAWSCAEDELEDSMRSDSRAGWEGYWGSNSTSTNSMVLFLLPRTGATMCLQGCFHNVLQTGSLDRLHPDGVTVRFEPNRCPWAFRSVSAAPVEYYVGKYRGSDALLTNDVAIALAACMNMDPRRNSNFLEESDAGFLLRRWDGDGSPMREEGPTELPEVFRGLLVSRPLRIAFETSVVCAVYDDSIAGRVSIGAMPARIRILEGSTTPGQMIAFTIPGRLEDPCAILHISSEPDSGGLIDARVEPITLDLLTGGFDIQSGFTVRFPGDIGGE